MKAQRTNQGMYQYWCHLCRLRFPQSIAPGVAHVVCRNCRQDFTEIIDPRTLPQSYEPYQASVQPPYSFMSRRNLPINHNILTQIVEIENQIENQRTLEVTEETLRRIRWVVEGADAECVVCKEEMKVGEQCVRASCRHVFHEDCLKGWLGRKNSCPTCRKQIIPQNQNESWAGDA